MIWVDPKKTAIGGALGACLIAGCTPVSPASSHVPRSQSAGPASGPTSAELAGQLFAEVCIQTAPSFAAAKTVLAARGFTQNSITHTYYLTSENLSIKLIDSSFAADGVLNFDDATNPDTCSLVVATDADSETAVAQLAQGSASVLTAPPPPGISVTSQQRDDLLFLNARLTAQ